MLNHCPVDKVVLVTHTANCEKMITQCCLLLFHQITTFSALPTFPIVNFVEYQRVKDRVVEREFVSN